MRPDGSFTPPGLIVQEPHESVHALAHPLAAVLCVENQDVSGQRLEVNCNKFFQTGHQVVLNNDSLSDHALVNPH